MSVCEDKFWDQACVAFVAMYFLLMHFYLQSLSVRSRWAELKYGNILAVGGRGQRSAVGGRSNE